MQINFLRRPEAAGTGILMSTLWTVCGFLPPVQACAGVQVRNRA